VLKATDKNMPSKEQNNPPQASKKIKMPALKGMYILRALQFIQNEGLVPGEILYTEDKSARFTGVVQNIEPETEVDTGTIVDLQVASQNPLQFLPALYQNNDFLKNYLWLFQHIFNSFHLKLDNIHRYFNPIEAPQAFYEWLATWFAINVNYTITEEKMRSLIKDAVSLFQWRGTVIGLTKYLEILTDVRPEIIENYMPVSTYTIEGDKLVERPILEHKTARYKFTVKFPVAANHFDIEAIRKINKIIAAEKPAYADFYVTFQPRQKKQDKYAFTIGLDTVGDKTII
jgi:phage tail-like protein